MDKLKQWVALTVVGCMAVLAAGWFLLVSPKRTEAAEVRANAASQVLANKALATQLDVLRAQAKDLPAQKAKLAAVAAKVPTNRALPALIRALTDAATDAGVELVSVAPGPTTLVALAAPAAPVAAGTGGAGAPGTPAAPAAPVGGAAGQLATIPVTLNVVGGYFQVQQFVSNVEELKRALRLTSVVLAPGANPVKPGTAANVDDGRSLAATLTGSVYMAAGVPAAPAAPVAAGTTGTTATVPAS